MADVYNPWKTSAEQYDMSWPEGFGRSVLHAAGPAMFGVQPGGGLADWQAERPGATMAADLLGFMVPYGAFAKVGMKLPGMAKGVRAVDPFAKKHPIMGSAVQEMVRWSPLEAGRVVGGSLFGEDLADSIGGHYQGSWSQSLEGLVNIGLAGGAGAVFGGLSAYGAKTAGRKAATPGATMGAIPQVQIREMRKAIQDGKIAPELIPEVETTINELRMQIRQETGKPIGKLDVGDSAKINSLFSVTSSTKAPVARSAVPLDAVKYKEFETNFGLPADFDAMARIPRVIRPRDAKAQASLDARLKDLHEVDGIKYAYDDAYGDFVLAKQGQDKSWLLFKTDSPGIFAPKAQQWATSVGKVVKNWVDMDVVNLEVGQSALLAEASNLEKMLPRIDWRQLGEMPKKSKLSKALAELYGVERTQNAQEGMRRVGQFVKGYLAPAMHQFRDNPLAGRVHTMAKELKDHAEMLAQKSVLGAYAQQIPKGGIWATIAKGQRLGDEETIFNTAMKMDGNSADWENFLRAWFSGEDLAQAITKYNLSPQAKNLLEQVAQLDAQLTPSIIDAQKAMGLPKAEMFVPKKNHMMASHLFEGSWRVPIYDEKGALVWMASGLQKSGAEKQAKTILEANPGWKADTAREADFMEEMQLLKKLAIGSQNYQRAVRLAQNKFQYSPPNTFKKREDVGGYITEMSPQEFIKTLVQHNQRYRLYEAKLATDAITKKDRALLMAEDPDAATRLESLLERVYGQEGEFSRAVNKAADTVLAPMLGKNSATKISSAINKTMHRWTLGFGNIGYGISNMVSFLQTSFPYMALLTSVPHERIGRYSTWMPLVKGREAKAIGTIDALKIHGQAFKEMGSPDELLWKNYQKAALDGTVDPRFIDEVVGINAVNKQTLKQLLNTPGQMDEFIWKAADFIPGMTEKGARGHAFTTGHIFFRDVFGVKDPDLLYKLAKEYTEKTQFLYSVGDRAQLITGPLGNNIGLFKNWVMHYIGWMMAYAGEGISHSNLKPLLFMMAGSGAVGGVGGLVGKGAVDGLAKLLGNDSLLDTVYGTFGTDDGSRPLFADALYYGLPGLLGFSIQNTVQMPFTNPIDDAQFMFTAASWQQGKAMAESIGSAWDVMTKMNKHPAEDPKTRDLLMRAFLPKSIGRTVQSAYAMGDGQLISPKTGYPELANMSTGELLFYGASMPPTRLAAARELRTQLWEDQEARKNAVATFGKQYEEASMVGNWAEVRDILLRAQAQGLAPDSVIRSGNTRLAEHEKDSLARQFDDELLWRYQQMGLYRP